MPPGLSAEDAQELRMRFRNPLLSVRRRADRAIELATHRPFPLPHRWFDDGYIRTYLRFLCHHLDEMDDLEALAQNSNDADLANAWRAHLLMNSRPNAVIAYLIRARILAGQTNEEIAAKSGLEPGTVDFFQKLFFGVRSRLEKRIWIFNSALYPARCLAIAPDTTSVEQQGYVWMHIGYTGKSLALESLFDGDAETPSDASALAKWLDERRERDIRLLQYTAALLWEPKWLDFEPLVAAMTSLQKMQSAHSDGVSEEYMEKMLQRVNRYFPGK